MKNKFQIIIPMTGNGSRFVAAGYKDLKPMIKVQGKPIIEWIVRGMLSAEDDIIFICRESHLQDIPGYESYLKSLVKGAKIVSIQSWEKRGPVYDIMKAEAQINDEFPTVITYCDYFMLWDLRKFKTEVLKRNCEGAIPCYSGFHPHLIPEKNLYASCRVDENENLLEIREKFSFQKDKYQARHSPGLYYFKSGALMKKYYQMTINEDLSLNGEYYSSLPYNLLVRDKLKVWAPVNIDFFCQWGTPEDLNDYLFWTNLVKGFSE
jgi:NDP-sugar pyrophosphorylase family protein